MVRSRRRVKMVRGDDRRYLADRLHDLGKHVYFSVQIPVRIRLRSIRPQVEDRLHGSVVPA